MSKLIEINPITQELHKLNMNQYCLVVAHLAGENYKELAFNFGLPVGTVKSRLSRATAILLENRKNAATANINQQ